VRALAAAALALGACGYLDGTRACGGAAGLHVVVDLSGPLCEHLTTWGIAVQLPSVTLTPDTATSKRESWGPRRMEYTWAWPQDVPDGVALAITWSGSGEAFTSGSADASAVAHPGDCEEVDLAATCGSTLADAQP
jgi:hypothetical protein